MHGNIHLASMFPSVFFPSHMPRIQKDKTSIPALLCWHPHTRPSWRYYVSFGNIFQVQDNVIFYWTSYKGKWNWRIYCNINTTFVIQIYLEINWLIWGYPSWHWNLYLGMWHEIWGLLSIHHIFCIFPSLASTAIPDEWE